MKKKVTYTPRTRVDVSSPFSKIGHSELLKMANIKLFTDGYKVHYLPNGRVIVLPTGPDKDK